MALFLSLFPSLSRVFFWFLIVSSSQEEALQPWKFDWESGGEGGEGGDGLLVCLRFQSLSFPICFISLVLNSSLEFSFLLSEPVQDLARINSDQPVLVFNLSNRYWISNLVWWKWITVSLELVVQIKQRRLYVSRSCCHRTWIHGFLCLCDVWDGNKTTWHGGRFIDHRNCHDDSKFAVIKRGLSVTIIQYFRLGWRSSCCLGCRRVYRKQFVELVGDCQTSFWH